MKSAILIATIAAASAGTNKTLAPTPGVGRPTPFPTDIGTLESPAPTFIIESPTPTAFTPFPTDLTPAPQPVVPRPATSRPQSFSIDYIIDGFSSSKSSKGSSKSGKGSSSKSGKGSGKSGKGSKGSSKSGKRSKGSSKSGKGWRHYDGKDHGDYGYYHALRRTRA